MVLPAWPEFVERGEDGVNMDVYHRVKPGVELEEEAAIALRVVGELEGDAALQRKGDGGAVGVGAGKLRDRADQAVDQVEPALGGERQADLVGGFVLAGRLAGEGFVLGRRRPRATLREAVGVERDADRAGDRRRSHRAFGRDGERPEDRLGAGLRIGVRKRLGDHSGIGGDVVRIGEGGDGEPWAGWRRYRDPGYRDRRRPSRRRRGCNWRRAPGGGGRRRRCR